MAEALIQWLRDSPDPGQRPVRMAVAIAPDAGDRVIACAAAFSHLTVDHGAIGILKRDFAAICAVVARRAGYRELVLPVSSSNRFERHLVHYVGSLAQSTILAVDIGQRSFDELADPAAWPPPLTAGSGRT